MSEDKRHSESFKRYLRGEMNAREAHAFERDALDDSFTQEALEGYEEIGAEHLGDLHLLQERLRKKKKKGFLWVRYVSAAVLLLAGAGSFYFFTNKLEETQELALSEEASEPQTLSQSNVTDTFQVQEKKVQEKKPIPEENESVANDDLAVSIPAEQIPTEIIEGEAYLSSREVSDDEISDNLEEAVYYEKAGETEFITMNAKKVELTLAASEPEELPSRGAEVSSYPSEADAEIQIREVDSFDKVEARTRKSTLGATERSLSSASENLLTGTVTDASGDPLPGVTVLIKGTVIGTATDLNGKYQLKNIPGSTLVFSFVGFKTQEIEAGSSDVIDISLGGSTELQEVVVTGSANTQPLFTRATPDGGMKAYKKYLKSNLSYPASARESGVEGTVLLQLSLSSNGSIENITIRRSLCAECDLEAIRLVREGPSWIPANRNGANLPDTVTLKVKFSLRK